MTTVARSTERQYNEVTMLSTNGCVRGLSSIELDLKTIFLWYFFEVCSTRGWHGPSGPRRKGTCMAPYMALWKVQISRSVQNTNYGIQRLLLNSIQSRPLSSNSRTAHYYQINLPNELYNDIPIIQIDT